LSIIYSSKNLKGYIGNKKRVQWDLEEIITTDLYKPSPLIQLLHAQGIYAPTASRLWGIRGTPPNAGR
jgi:hypothetical protein